VQKNTFQTMMTTLFWLVPIMGAMMTGCATKKIPSAPPLSDKTAAFVANGRAQMREDKMVLVNEAMNFNSADPNFDRIYDAFWHTYYNYEGELKKINDQRIQLIRDYEFNYENMDDNIANNLAERALAIHKKRLDLLAKYYEKMKKATSPLIAAKFLQVEYQISLLMDIDIASKTPLMPEKEK
jgi:hypothetical protein